MIFSTWLRNWKSSLDRRWALRQTLRRKPGARCLASRPRLESLEDRCLLTPYIVTNGAGNADPGTLIYGIEQVNAGNYDGIDFQIGATGSAQTINLSQPLPALTASNVYINGLSQGGIHNTTQLITVNGANDSSTPNIGLALEGSNCTVSGLILEGFNVSNNNNLGIGIAIDGNNEVIGGTTPGAGNILIENQFGIQISGSGTLIQGNYIGTDAAGTSSLGNSNGIELDGIGNTIGGTVSAARNIISGNSNNGVVITASGNQVLGNYIGTNSAGTGVLANGTGIEVNSSGNLVGGAASGAGNLISGNSGAGLVVANSDLVLGNFIGTNADGSAALANGTGIVMGSNNTVGGTATGKRNVISGNTNDDVLINGSSNQVLGNYIGSNAAGNAALPNNNGIEIVGANNTIGGTASGARNLISGNYRDGVLIDSSGSGNSVLGNYIGTKAAGTAALANGIGIEVAGSSNVIGGRASGARNLISGNNTGVNIDSGGNGNSVLGNYIGTDLTGATATGTDGNPLGNISGILVDGSGNVVGGTVSGAGNLISGNRNSGVWIVSSGSGNSVLGNSIGVNAAGKAALANGTDIFLPGSNNTVGGTVSGASNLISGDGYQGVYISGNGNQVLGNYVGTDLTGTTATGTDGNPLGNSIGIEVAGSNNTVGGTASGARNLISGNSKDGVLIDSNASGNQVLGNYVGTNAAGRLPLANSIGIEVDGGGNTVGGTVSGAGNLISGNSNDGVRIVSDSDQVAGNYIGTNAAGSAALANGDGVYVNGNSNTIGGTVSAARNLISGNTAFNVQIDINVSGNSVLGNYIGTNAAGTLVLGNNSIGVMVDGNNSTIGGTSSAARNVISGNSKDGLLIGGTGNSVLGNYIGTNAAGTAVLANSVGVEIANSSNVIGGTASGAGNLISGNSNDGVLIQARTNTTSISGNQVLGNFIGTNAAGKAALANDVGIYVAGNSNVIGGTASGARNLISGNSSGVLIAGSSSGNQVLGNYIGTDLTGTTATGTDGKPLGNSDNGIDVDGFNTTVGGAVSGAGNLISGNGESGVLLEDTSGDEVLGNLIGTNAAGTAKLANGAGINVQDSVSTTIGGAVSGAGNLISGNDIDGVFIGTGSSGIQVLGNSIGVNVAGTASLANGIGIEVKATGNTVGGTVAGTANLISGNLQDGVRIDAAGSSNQVLGNSIGVNAAGTVALANSGNGIEVRGNSNTVGGAVSGAANLISGNSKDGVLIDSNSIGTRADGSGPLPNSVGVGVTGNSDIIGGTVSGASNLISGNQQDGVFLNGNDNQVVGNYIGTTADGRGQLANSVGVYVQGAGNTVGGTVSGASNLISGNHQDGVLIAGSSNLVLGNYIGTDAAGNTAVPNSVGIGVSGNSNTIGGTASGAANFISGNSGDGILIDNSTNGTAVQGNSIGLDVTGAALGNGGYGVNIAGNKNSIGGSDAGAGNSIASNKKGGVLLSAGSGNTIRQNSLFANGSTNTGPGISLSKGANNNLAAPSLSSVTLSGTTLTIKGTFTAPTANVPYVLDFYANPLGDAEGKVFLDSTTLTPNSTGTQPFTFTTTAPTGTTPLITASLTDASGNTSAFSNGLKGGFQLGSPPPNSPPPGSAPTSSSTLALSPLQETLEVALDTAAYLLQGNVPALLELEGLSVMLLGQTLPQPSELLTTILAEWSVSPSAGLLGLQLGLGIVKGMNAPPM